MPGNIPATSAYTYAVEYSIDENLEYQGQIQFNQPIFSYLENFVGIPVGWAVPSAYFDRKKGHWIPTPDGRVIRRSEEHTSELQSRENLVCRLLLEKKK